MRRVFHALKARGVAVALAGLLALGVITTILLSSSSAHSSAKHHSPARSAGTPSTKVAGATGPAPGADPVGATTSSIAADSHDPQRPTAATTPGGATPATTAAAAAPVNPAASASSPGGGSAGPSFGVAPGIVIASTTFDLPDPYVLDWAGTYYMYVSTPFGDTQQNAPVLEGRPGDWRGPVDVLPNLPPWAQQQYTWTPAVYRIGSNFVLYFAALKASSSLHCIGAGVSTSGRPDGPFATNPDPLVCNTGHGGDIDPQAFYDPSGPDGPANPYYLIWKADGNSIGQTPTFWAQGLSNDGMTVTGQPHLIYGPREGWQRGLIEAPQMVKDPSGQLWMFFSGGGLFNSPTYAMGFAKCQSEFGPCSDTTTVPLIGSNSQGVGPGEETVFVGPDGSTWLLYNPWYAGQWFKWVRPAEAARIIWLSAGPAVAIPPGPFPAP